MLSNLGLNSLKLVTHMIHIFMLCFLSVMIFSFRGNCQQYFIILHKHITVAYILYFCRLGVTLNELLWLFQSKKPQLITLSSSGKYIGFCENHKIRIWEVQTKDSDHAIHRTIRLHHTKKLSILAFHPTERIVAAGDVTGRILIWRHFGERTFSVPDKLENREVIKDAEERPGVRGDDDADLCTTWHWHSAEVRVLFFSSDGAYLYSGRNTKL